MCLLHDIVLHANATHSIAHCHQDIPSAAALVFPLIFFFSNVVVGVPWRAELCMLPQSSL